MATENARVFGKILARHMGLPAGVVELSVVMRPDDVLHAQTRIVIPREQFESAMREYLGQNTMKQVGDAKPRPQSPAAEMHAAIDEVTR
jgi:hypothetical protein